MESNGPASSDQVVQTWVAAVLYQISGTGIVDYLKLGDQSFTVGLNDLASEKRGSIAMVAMLGLATQRNIWVQTDSSGFIATSAIHDDWHNS